MQCNPTSKRNLSASNLMAAVVHLCKRNRSSLSLFGGVLSLSSPLSKCFKRFSPLLSSIRVVGLNNHFESVSSSITSTNAAPFFLVFTSSIKSKSTHNNNHKQRKGFEVPNRQCPSSIYLTNSNARKNGTPNSKKRGPLASAHMTAADKEMEFDKWTQKLQRGFQPEDVVEVLKQQTDTDITFDIFRWASQQRRYKHNHLTYQFVIQKLFSEAGLDKMEILIDEVMAGACDGTESLYNTIIYVCIQSRWLGKAINMYRLMRKSSDCKPSLRTYNLLLSAFVNKDTHNSYISHMYMENMRALFKQLIDADCAPDIFTLNMMIKGYAKSLHVNDALRIFHQIEEVYGCTPDAYTYNYLIRGLCLQSRTVNAMEIYREMIGKGFVPSNIVYNSLVNSLSLAGELSEAIKLLREMLDKVRVPDFITYKTLVDGLCRGGMGHEARELLHEFRLKDRALDGFSYRKLLTNLHLSDGMDHQGQKLGGYK